jgi:spermidine/putrescine transport system ATP-binding protein
MLDLTVRPEKLVLSTDRPDAGRCRLRGRVQEVVYLGTSTQYAVRLRDGTALTVFVQNASDANDLAGRGEDVWLSWLPEHSLALAESGTDQTDPGEHE